MNQMTPLQSPARQKPTNQVNPFARALAEKEQNAFGNPAAGEAVQQQQDSKLFSDALSKSGGNFGNMDNQMSADYLKQQQEAMLEKQRKEALRKRLHDQVNPVDMQAVFDAREREVKREIQQLRQELKSMVVQVAKYEKEIEMTLLTEVTEVGDWGAYFKNFFRELRNRLRRIIKLFKSSTKLSSTWHSQGKGKKGKKGKKPGLEVGGQQHEKTSTVQDMMHHERSTSALGA